MSASNVDKADKAEVEEWHQRRPRCPCGLALDYIAGTHCDVCSRLMGNGLPPRPFRADRGRHRHRAGANQKASNDRTADARDAHPVRSSSRHDAPAIPPVPPIVTSAREQAIVKRELVAMLAGVGIEPSRLERKEIAFHLRRSLSDAEIATPSPSDLIHADEWADSCRSVRAPPMRRA